MTDYLEFTTIITPSIERRKLDVGDIFINQVRHTKCGWIIRSKNRHDWVTCKCGELSLDSGSWYQANERGHHECREPRRDVQRASRGSSMNLLPYLIPALKLAGRWIAMFLVTAVIIVGTLYLSLFIVPVLIWHT